MHMALIINASGIMQHVTVRKMGILIDSDCYRDAQWTGWIHSRVRGVQNIKDGCIFMLCNVRLYFQNSVCLSAAPIVCDHRGKYVAVLDYQCEQDSAVHW